MSILTGPTSADNPDFVATYLMEALAQEDSQLVAADERVRTLSAQVQRIERKLAALRQAEGLLREAYEAEAEL